ncbi:hypothetical protein TUM20983_38050 [Mycobacterium antarcticum]|uniref:hypothetical protein n=1 Tax=Mycolicibacterium sp. TUM20983 TaxID=3023369 RepID=UPI002385A0E1|nr:hypothetical protein [Mycolicibacterium sp. TUM20983]GLP76695.1 hypothetical protein TUM20983_38050 [Mycolicibacterium sp. TUM20983]
MIAFSALGNLVRRLVERIERGKVPLITDERWLPSVFADECDERLRTYGPPRNRHP